MLLDLRSLFEPGQGGVAGGFVGGRSVGGSFGNQILLVRQLVPAPPATPDEEGVGLANFTLDEEAWAGSRQAVLWQPSYAAGDDEVLALGLADEDPPAPRPVAASPWRAWPTSDDDGIVPPAGPTAVDEDGWAAVVETVTWRAIAFTDDADGIQLKNFPLEDDPPPPATAVRAQRNLESSWAEDPVLPVAIADEEPAAIARPPAQAFAPYVFAGDEEFHPAVFEDEAFRPAVQTVRWSPVAVLVDQDVPTAVVTAALEDDPPATAPTTWPRFARLVRVEAADPEFVAGTPLAAAGVFRGYAPRVFQGRGPRVFRGEAPRVFQARADRVFRVWAPRSFEGEVRGGR